MGFFDAITKPISDVTGAIFGGQKSAVTAGKFAPMTPEEQARLQDIEAQQQQNYGSQGKQENLYQGAGNDISSLFTQHLKDFLTSGGQVTPDQMKQASDFVDQTFTNPAQALIDQQNQQFEAAQQAKAAEMGRGGTDVQLNQAINSNARQNALQLGAERGSRIQNATNDIYNRTLGSLNAGESGGGFLNNLAQQAYSNRINLLNNRTGLAQLYQTERGVSPVGMQTSPGILSGLTSAIGGISDLGEASGGLKGAGGLGGVVKGLGGIL